MAEKTKQFAKVLKHPGIPVPTKPRLRGRWVFMWASAVFVVFGLPWILGRGFLYSQTIITIDNDELADLSVNVEGCDVIFEPTYRKLQVRLGYWTFMGTGTAEHKGDLVEVQAVMSRKALAFHCLLIVMVPHGSRGPHFRNLNLTIEPSARALTLPRPSNVAEMISAYIDSVQVEDAFRLNISTMCDTTLHDVSASDMHLHVHGGSLTITDGAKTNAKAGTTNIVADNVMVMLYTQQSDLFVAFDNRTAPVVSLAAASLKQDRGSVRPGVEEGDGLEHYHLAPGKGAGNSRLDVRISATDSAVYALALDKATIAGKGGACPELETHQGELAAGPPQLLPAGVQTLGELATWLKSPTNSVEFVVYIHAPAPMSQYDGMLKLLSTEIYTAMTPVGFALLSGGAMEPYVIRISVPMLGIPWALSGRACGGPKDADVLKYGFDVLAAVEEGVSTPALGLDSARWVWEADQQPTYIFDRVPAKHGRSAKWKQRPVSALSSFSFRAASCITMLVGVMAGLAICKVLWMTVRPMILEVIRSADLFSTASYRLQHTNEAAQWAVVATFVQWPMPGILIKWSKRPMAAKFSKLTFQARPWPPGDKRAKIMCSGIDATRLPTVPSLPDQECFLFCSCPGDRQGESPWLPKKFDVELFTTGMLQYGRQQPHMAVGKPYQIKVTAMDAAGRVVEKSQWSRPTTVQPPQAFTEYPLLLWRGCFGSIPDNTLESFINESCLDIKPSPTLVLGLSSFRLAVDSGSTIFQGEAVGLYGADKGGLFSEAAEKARVQVSSGGIVGLYESTKSVPLPTQEERADSAKGIVRTVSQALPERPKDLVHGLETSKFVVLDFPDDVVSLPVGYDTTALVRIEAAVETDEGQRSDTAKVEMTWQQIMDLVTSQTLVEIEQYGSSKVPTTNVDVVLRDGLTPVAVLSFQCSFTHTVVEHLRPPAQQAGQRGAPNIFRSVLPGNTFIWGESKTLDWECSEVDKGVVQGATFDIVLVAEGYDGARGPSYNRGPSQRTETLVAEGVQACSEKEAIMLTPDQPMTCQLMRCHLEARLAGAADPESVATGLAKGVVLVSSWEFVITRPATLQQVELAYAAFCIRNQIPMQAMPLAAMSSVMVETAERCLYHCSGYRGPLPIPSEMEEEDAASGKALIVSNPSSIIITKPDGLQMEASVLKDVVAEQKSSSSLRRSPSSIGRGSSGNGSLNEPLLTEAGQLPQPMADRSPATQEVLARLDTLVVTTNVFWKWDLVPIPHLFLKYGFLPKYTESVYIVSTLEYWGWSRSAKLIADLDVLDFVIRYVLGTLLFWIQMGTMGFPGLLLFVIWLWHDSVLSKMWPDLITKQDAYNIFLVDFIISPCFTRWQHIDTPAKVVCVTLVFYIAIAVGVACYCNFILPTSPRVSRAFHLFNSLVAGMWALSFFFSVVLVTVVLVWILMGALVNPAILLPYAIMMLAIVAIYVSLHGKLSAMASHARKGIEGMLENTLRALFEVFVADPVSDVQLEDFKKYLQTQCLSVSENMAQMERDQREAMLKQSGITMEVGDCLRAQMDTLRSSAYFTTLQGKAKNQVLLTDFVPGTGAKRAAIVKKAQEAAIEEATISGTNMLGTTQTTTAMSAEGTEVATTMAAAAPPITPASLGTAIAQHQGIPMEKPGNLSAGVSELVPKLSSQLSLNPATVMAALNGYVLQLQLARTKCRPPKLEDAYSCAKLFSRIRHERLFSHFMPQEVQDPDGTGIVQDCNARKMLWELQNVELENLRAKAASVYTKVIDWTCIGRLSSNYVIGTLYLDIITRTINEQLCTVVNDSVAFQISMSASELAFTKTASLYHSDPLQIFVDCGIIDEQYKRLPETQRVLTDVVDLHRAFDNSLAADNLLSAVRALCLPEAKPAPVNDIPSRSFLWLGALKSILKRLGWTQDEMAPEWLNRKWMAVTKGTGLFGYEDLMEVNDLIMTLSGEGLWKAAVKGMMLEVKIGGFLGFDVTRDGLDPAAKGAHHLAEDIDREDLEAVMNAAGVWPDYVEDAYRNCTLQAGTADPIFLRPGKILDFLRELVYMPESPDGVTFTELSPFATDVFDLVWCMGSDNAVWHTIGSTKRRLRGLWLELALQLFDALDSLPSDLDVFFKALDWQRTECKTRTVSGLRLDGFGRWLEAVYFQNQVWCTFCQFKGVVITLLNCDVPESLLKEQVFDPCPMDPNDDKGELRRLSDLGAALQVWMGFGLWPSAIEQAMEELLPRGRVLTVAKSILPEEFKKMDPDGMGVLQPALAVLLMHRLMVPGLTCDDMKSFIESQLSCSVPDREVHKYFVMMDVNGDGILSADEFIPMFVYFAFDFFPHHILRKLNLSPGNMAAFIGGVLGLLALIFALVSLVVSAFPTGRSISASIHTIVCGLSAYTTKVSSDQSIGFEDTMSNLKKQLEARALEAVVAVLGVSKAVIERLAALV